jgi:hypothetical protein
VRLVIARCSVDYVGRLTAHLPSALRLLIVKADGSVLVHSDGGSYKPLNWMSPPCRLAEEPGRWTVTNRAGETLSITIEEVLSDSSADLGIDPGLVKDGVESHLQELLAVQLHVLGDGWRLVRREYPTPIGPVDLMCRDADGTSVAVEIKRRGEIDGSDATEGTEGTASGGGAYVAVEIKRHAGIDAVEQLTRYLELLNRDPLLAPVKGVLAAQTIKLQARTLAEDRGIRCVVLDYDAMRGIEREGTLFLCSRRPPGNSQAAEGAALSPLPHVITTRALSNRMISQKRLPNLRVGLSLPGSLSLSSSTTFSGSRWSKTYSRRYQLSTSALIVTPPQPCSRCVSRTRKWPCVWPLRARSASLRLRRWLVLRDSRSARLTACLSRQPRSGLTGCSPAGNQVALSSSI